MSASQPIYKIDELKSQRSAPRKPANDDKPLIPGEQLLDDIVVQLKRLVVLPPYAAEVQAVWVLVAHTHNAWQHSPRLVLNSPTPSSGKTRNLKVLEALIPRSKKADYMTEAVMRRMFGSGDTIMLDEADTFFNDKPDFRSALNAGFERGGKAYLTAKNDKTQQHEVQSLVLWAPVVIAGIGDDWMWEALKTRSFIFTLKRKLPTERAEDWTEATEAEVKKRGKIAAAWAEQNMEALKNATPDIPEELQNRDRDKWRPLIAVADLVGGAWPDRIRAIARAMSGGTDDTVDSVVTILFRVKEVFDGKQVDKISSADLAMALHDAGHIDLDQTSIAAALKKFGIEPRQIKFGDKNLRGYRREWFEDDWFRYGEKVAG